jgi:hypothetical protein
MGERGPRWATLGTRLSLAFRRIADLHSIRRCRCLMRLVLKFCWTGVGNTAKRLLAAYSGREVANAKTDRPLRRMITLLRVDVGSVAKNTVLKTVLVCSSQTVRSAKCLKDLVARARTWDPPIKSQPRVEDNQRLAGRTPGLIRLKMGIRRTLTVRVVGTSVPGGTLPSNGADCFPWRDYPVPDC